MPRAMRGTIVRRRARGRGSRARPRRSEADSLTRSLTRPPLLVSHARTPTALSLPRPERALSLPPPLWGRVGWGVHTGSADVATPLPGPPPQGGREQKQSPSANDSTKRQQTHLRDPAA